MDSLKELFKIGCGPSSSHTMGPERAAKKFSKENENAHSFKVELYGSLAATGKGHLTDWIIEETLKPKKTEIVWMPEYVHPYHTNGMKFIALDENGNSMNEWLVFSVGGGTIKDLSDAGSKTEEVYKLNKLEDIIKWCKENNKELWQYVEECEGPEIWDHLKNILDTMHNAVSAGIEKDGILPGKLRLQRRAKSFFEKIKGQHNYHVITKKIFAYALAVAEENSSAGTIVTAPTCGAAGVIPGLLRAMREEHNLDETICLRALAIGGLIGNLIKQNATISGAEAGCQAEIGSACSMAAAMATYILGGTLEQIEYAAEMGMEHHLGMTCDPIGGYVQIPCIERNAIVAVRSLNTADYALSTDGGHTISFDQVVITMKETGKDMCPSYKETSIGGLAKYYEQFLKD
ncbi:L-serine ammonia-lyase, iron-sulfur-dependent, subunit alpha [Fusobacterium sp.]|uniref:L-serine ammonia-lyase, iron-sulfur-dependent, subunit alpha n=1 Tax=Fusobacterium sp. TaxID=68766 RepID=UPI00260DD0E9|nr:L-serine ammonia-lyase, iron-sulfur-dependent, subunit alpha [Fusobacterium sp.]